MCNDYYSVVISNIRLRVSPSAAKVLWTHILVNYTPSNCRQVRRIFVFKWFFFISKPRTHKTIIQCLLYTLNSMLTKHPSKRLPRVWLWSGALSERPCATLRVARFFFTVIFPVSFKHIVLRNLCFVQLILQSKLKNL